MTAKKVSQEERKISVLVMLTAGEIKFLNRKINQTRKEFESRSSIIRYLISKAIMNPALLD